MAEHADKIPDRKSQAAGHKSAQPQGGSGLGSGFVDKRAVGVMQRKLQEVADSSAQVKQAAQLRTMADNSSTKNLLPIQRQVEPADGETTHPWQKDNGETPSLLPKSSHNASFPLQLKPSVIQMELKEGAFNVVGETDHRKSPQDAKKEFDFLYFNGYIEDEEHLWTEHSLKIEKNKGDVREGDSWAMRKDSVLAFLEATTYAFIVSPNQDQLATLNYVVRMVRGEYKNPTKDDKLIEGIKIAKEIQNILKKRKGKDIENDQIDKIRLYYQEIKILRGPNAKNPMEIGKDRSEYMHESANLAVEKKMKGVWMIGAAHADHMKVMPGRGYKLTNGLEFELALKDYLTEEQADNQLASQQPDFNDEMLKF